jgi:hypothetical protein
MINRGCDGREALAARRHFISDRFDPQHGVISNGVTLENMNADDAALPTAEDNRGKPRSSRTHPGDRSSKSRFRRGTSGEENLLKPESRKIRAQFYPSHALASSPFRRETRDRRGFSGTAARDSNPDGSRRRDRS